MTTEEKKDLELKSLEAPGGGVSSSRLNEKKMRKFLIWYIIVYGILLFGYAVLAMYWQKDTQNSILNTLVNIYMFTVVAIAISTYAPKMWGKVTETFAKFSKNDNSQK